MIIQIVIVAKIKAALLEEELDMLLKLLAPLKGIHKTVHNIFFFR